MHGWCRQPPVHSNTKRGLRTNAVSVIVDGTRTHARPRRGMGRANRPWCKWQASRICPRPPSRSKRFNTVGLGVLTDACSSHNRAPMGTDSRNARTWRVQRVGSDAGTRTWTCKGQADSRKAGRPQGRVAARPGSRKAGQPQGEEGWPQTSLKDSRDDSASNFKFIITQDSNPEPRQGPEPIWFRPEPEPASSNKHKN